MKFGAWSVVFLVLSLEYSLEWAGAHGEITEQIKLLSQRIEKAPEAQLYYRRAELFREHRDWEKAEQDYRRAADLDSSLATVPIGRAQLELDRSRAEQCLVLLKPFLEKQDENANAHLLKARALRQLGKYSVAVTSYSDAIARFKPPIADHYLERAQVIALASPGEPKKAIESIDQGLAERGHSISLQERALKGKYGDFIREMDHSTGRILQAIRNAGLDDNTLVVFTSDNGSNRLGSTGGLNGGRYCTMEGGHRVPGIFRWPGQIPAGQVSDVTLTSMDLLPLFCELAGVKQPSDRKIDGKRILPILQGKESATPHKLLYYYNGTNLQAVREGNWKLHLPRAAKDQPFWCKKPIAGRVFLTLDQPALFNLNDDLGEKHNLTDQHPKVMARLQNHAETVRAELGDVRVTGTDQRPIKLKDPQER